jgi:murein DD-endopeptidase MepM/ murein hydrolase activator NlpD
MKKVLGLSLLFLLMGASLFAGIDDKKKKKTAAKKKPHKTVKVVKPAVKEIKKEDTTAVAIIKDEIFMDSVDSLLMFPSHDLYGSWDTSLCHPYLFDQHFTTDSTTIYLLDDWSCGFTLPYRGPVTSGFGWRRRRPHYGTDINLETGDTVVAAFDGRVRIAKFNKGGYGNVVIIRHNNGLETVYGHLSKLLVEPGTEVTSGTVIGLGGNTGHSYGSHLHFEMRFLGRAMDTEDIVDYEKGEIKNSALVLYKEDFADKYDLRAIHAHSKSSRTHTTSAAAAKSSKGGKVVTVKNGDTLGKIAQRNHTTISAICKKNGIKQTKVLQIGMRLKV